MPHAPPRMAAGSAVTDAVVARCSTGATLSEPLSFALVRLVRQGLWGLHLCVSRSRPLGVRRSRGSPSAPHTA